MAYKTIVEDNIDILVAGAGLGGTGAAFEARYWGQDKKIVIADFLASHIVDQVFASRAGIHLRAVGGCALFPAASV